MIPGNRPEDQAFESWLDGDIGDVLFELAKLSMPDIRDHDRTRQSATDPEWWFCKRCHDWWRYDFPEAITTCPWPPFDVKSHVLEQLQKIKREVESS